MGQEGLLGAFEEQVLLAVARGGSESYGMTVRRDIEERTARSVSIGAVYATMDRLETKGLIATRVAEPAIARKGRARKFFRLEEAGARALLRARELHASMWEGVDLSHLLQDTGSAGLSE